MMFYDVYVLPGKDCGKVKSCFFIMGSSTTLDKNRLSRQDWTVELQEAVPNMFFVFFWAGYIMTQA